MLLIAVMLVASMPTDGVRVNSREVREAEKRLPGFYAIRLDNAFPSTSFRPVESKNLFAEGTLAKPKKYSYYPAPFLSETFDRNRGQFKIRLENSRPIRFGIENTMEQDLDFLKLHRFFNADLNCFLLSQEELLLARWSLEMFHEEATLLDEQQFKTSELSYVLGTGKSFQRSWTSQRPDGKHVELIFNGQRFELCYYTGKFKYSVCRRPNNVTPLVKRIELDYRVENDILELRSIKADDHLPVKITICRGSKTAKLMTDAIELCQCFQSP